MTGTAETTELPPGAEDTFQIRRQGDIAIIIPSAKVEGLPSNLIEPAARMVLAPLKASPPTYLIVDLSSVNYFGSEFVTLLLRCHEILKPHGSELVLAGVGERIRELLRVMSLDTLWAIYSTRAEAIAALSGD